MFRRHHGIKKATSTKVVFGIMTIFFVLYAVSLLIPLAYIVISSFKDSFEYLIHPFSMPETWHFENYVKAFEKLKIEDYNLFTMFFNSLWLTLGGTLISILVSSMTAYVVAKYHFRLRNFIYSLAIFIMIIPIVGNFPAMYKLMNDLHLRNSPLILLTYTSGFGFNFLILYGNFKSISWSYAEAAFIDGAGHCRAFFNIMLPQAKNCLLAIGLIGAIGIWNDYMTPFVYLPDYPTLASGLYRFESIMADYGSDYPVYFAGVILSLIPILVLFIIFQDTLMSNTVAGGLKG